MVIVDTTVWIDYLGGTTNPHTSWLNRELTRQRLGLTDLILCEVLQGIRGDAVFTHVHHDLLRVGSWFARRLIASSQLSVWMEGTLCFTAIRITIHLRHISVYRSFIHELPIYRKECRTVMKSFVTRNRNNPFGLNPIRREWGGS